ncbi:hypothetical protein [Sphingomonas sp. 3-13AW]|uniref:hypothetical protein n=1 Tax=Sphingomonas sp. 3-13AW TaxID=3050450 RepID=UPI003BB699D4
MTQNAWRQRSAAIRRSAAVEGFDVARLVRIATVGDPHGQHVGAAFNALVPIHKVEGRIEDVALPISRGAWAPPTELCDARTLARRQVLADLLTHSGDADAQTAVLTAAFVHSHVTMSNRRRYSWPIAASNELVSHAVAHLACLGTRMVLPVEGTFALMGTSNMCRAAPEPYCTDTESLDRAVGRHLARSFRGTVLLALRIEAGGVAAAKARPADTRGLLALEREDLARLVTEQGLEELCRTYGMKMRDITTACRRRGIDVARLAA